MDIFILLNLISIFIAFFVGVYVYAKNPGRAINRVFLVYSMAVVITTFAGYHVSALSSYNALKFWGFLANLWPFIFAGQLHLIVIYIVPAERIRRFWLYIIWLSLPLVIIASITESFDLELPWISPAHRNFTTDLIKTAYSATASAVILFLGIKYLIKTPDILKRSRMALLLTGIMLPTFYGILFFGPFDTNFDSAAMPQSIVVFAGWILILIAIRQYRLFDITPVFAADAIISIMKEGLLLTDWKSRIRVANNAFYSMTGFKESGILGHNIDVFFSRCEFLDVQIPEIYTQSEIINKQFYFRHESGEMIPMMFTNSFLKKRTGRFIGCVLVLTDIRELTEAQEQLRIKHFEMIRLARQAGMAEVVGDVMHNIGNVLTSVNVSTEKIDEILERSRLKGLTEANRLLSEKVHSSEKSLMDDDTCRMLADYYIKLEECLRNEQVSLSEENKLLARKLNLIRSSVEMQQANIKDENLVDYIDIEEVVDEALMIMEDMLTQNNIEIVRNIHQKEVLTAVPRAKIFNIVLNIVKNAAESVVGNDPYDRRVEIQVDYNDEKIQIRISDNGSGISFEEMQNLFKYGFTTKKDGNGFGLHFCANAISELKGSIVPHSAGRGMGAEFVITVPRTATIIN